MKVSIIWWLVTLWIKQKQNRRFSCHLHRVNYIKTSYDICFIYHWFFPLYIYIFDLNNQIFCLYWLYLLSLEDYYRLLFYFNAKIYSFYCSLFMQMQDHLSRKHDSLQIIYENLATRRMHYNWISIYIVFVISQILFCSGLKIF